jgi:hypothetical protein
MKKRGYCKCGHTIEDHRQHENGTYDLRLSHCGNRDSSIGYCECSKYVSSKPNPPTGYVNLPPPTPESEQWVKDKLPLDAKLENHFSKVQINLIHALLTTQKKEILEGVEREVIGEDEELKEDINGLSSCVDLSYITSIRRNLLRLEQRIALNKLKGQS